MNTIWTPELTEGGPRYRALADAIAAAIEARALAAGEKLPPVRELAWVLKVTPGTVARAYQLAERRGLVQGEVGRGTFVRAANESVTESPAVQRLAISATPPSIAPDAIDLRHNHAPPIGQDAIITEALRKLATDKAPLPFTAYPAPERDLPERALLCEWLAAGGLPARPEDTILCNGAQQGVFTAYAACLGGRDAAALTDTLMHPGLKDCARSLGIRLEPVASDREGLSPSALEEAIERVRPGAILVTSNLHNPTLATMSLERREAIAEIALRRRLPIIEDDVYGWSDPATRLPSFVSLAPELTWYVASLSKCASSMIRAGFLVTPAGQGARAARLQRSFTSHMSYLTALLMAELIRSGDLNAIVAQVRAEAASRVDVARATIRGVLGDTVAEAFRTDPRGIFSWLPLPAPWRAHDLEQAAAEAGVLLSPSEVFAVGRAPAPHAVRMAFGAPESPELLEVALRRVAELVRQGPAATDAIA